MMQLFSEISDENKIGDSEERSATVYVQRGVFKKKKKAATGSKYGDGDPDWVAGQGHRGGKGSQKSTGGPIPAKKGQGRVIGKANQVKASRKEIVLDNLRVIPVNSDKKEVELIFDNPGQGEHDLRIYKVGEETNEPLKIKGIDGQSTDTVLAKFGHDDRISITIEASEGAHLFALEARVLVDVEAKSDNE